MRGCRCWDCWLVVVARALLNCRDTSPEDDKTYIVVCAVGRHCERGCVREREGVMSSVDEV